jgi:hypothetical protein
MTGSWCRAALALSAILFAGVAAHAEDVLAVTAANNLIRFDAKTPGTLISTTPITGLQAGEKIVGIDFRSLSGQLYGMGLSATAGSSPPTLTGRLYQINAVTGAATMVQPNPPIVPPALPNFSTTLVGSHYGMSYNSGADSFRVTNENGQNMSVAAGSGVLATLDPNLIYNDANSATAPHVVTVTFTNKMVSGGTSLFEIDSGLGVLALASGGGNNGFLTTVGKLGVQIGDNAGFVVSPFSGAAFAALQPGTATSSTLFNVDLATGTLSAVAAIGSPDLVIGLAIPPPPPSFGFGATSDPVNTAGGKNPSLVKFNLMNPSVNVAQVPITGMANATAVVALDFRPSTAELYALTSNGNTFGVIKIDPVAGTTTAVGAAFNFPNTFGGIIYSMSFDPVRDIIRVEDSAGLDARLDPTTGAILSIDPTPAYPAADPNAGVPTIAVATYTNKVKGATATTLLVINNINSKNLIATQNPQDAGTLNTQIYMVAGVATQLTTPVGNANAFQVAPDGRAFILRGSNILQLLNLNNGTNQNLGTIATPAGALAVKTLAIPSQTAGTNGVGSGVIQFSAATYNVIETNTAAITVSRTGGSSGVATIDFAIGTGGTASTPGGLANPATDYAPLTGTLTFLDGETSRTINVPTFDDKTLDLFKTVNLTLKNPVGAALGAQSTAVLIIADKDDTDGDGFTNELETLATTDPNNAASTPFSGAAAGTPQTLTVDKLSVKLNFAKTLGDSISISGSLPFSGNATGQQVLVDVGGVGGVLARFSLDKTGKDKKGTSRPSGGTNSFSLQSSKGTTAKYTVTLSKNTFATFLAASGLTSIDATKQTVMLQVNIYFNNVNFQVIKTLSYSAKKGKSGSAQILKTK